MNHISIVFRYFPLLSAKSCQLLVGTNFSCDGFITLPPLTLTSFEITFLCMFFSGEAIYEGQSKITESWYISLT